jgi:hypothetical protein
MKQCSVWYSKSYVYPMESAIVHIAQKFAHLLETYRRPDGRKWTGGELEGYRRRRAPLLRHQPAQGQNREPRLREARGDSKAMGFPPEVWFEEGAGTEGPVGPSVEGRGIARRVEHLFEVIRNPRKGEPYSNAEVARMTLGDL